MNKQRKPCAVPRCPNYASSGAIVCSYHGEAAREGAIRIVKGPAERTTDTEEE